MWTCYLIIWRDWTILVDLFANQNLVLGRMLQFLVHLADKDCIIYYNPLLSFSSFENNYSQYHQHCFIKNWLCSHAVNHLIYRIAWVSKRKIASPASWWCKLRWHIYCHLSVSFFFFLFIMRLTGLWKNLAFKLKSSNTHELNYLVHPNIFLSSSSTFLVDTGLTDYYLHCGNIAIIVFFMMIITTHLSGKDFCSLCSVWYQRLSIVMWECCCRGLWC